MKILFVDDEDTIRQLYIIYLENCLENADFVEAASGKQAIKILQNDHSFNLISSDYNMPNGSGGLLYTFVKKSRLDIPFVLLTSEDLEDLKEFSDFKQYNPLNRSLVKPFSKDDFESTIIEILSKGEKYKKKVDEGYKRIRIIHFLRFNKVLCDIHLRLSEKKHVKIINKNDTYSKETVRKYADKKQKYLYVKNEDYNHFAVGFSKTPFLVEDKNLPPEDIQRAITSSIEIAQEMVSTVGITPTVTLLVNHSFEQITRESQQGNRLKDLINSQRNRQDYVSDHSYLVAYIAEAICWNMNWGSDKTRIKLCYAAFFHDITIKNPDLAYALDVDEDMLWDFEEDEVAQAKKHIFEISAMLRESDETPPDVDSIIEQHHETPEQNGYPKQMSAINIFGLTGVFNVAHAFVNELYKSDFDEDMHHDIAKEVTKRFSKGHYRAPALSLEKVIESITI